jgi:ribosomal protein L24E
LHTYSSENFWIPNQFFLPLKIWLALKDVRFQTKSFLSLCIIPFLKCSIIVYFYMASKVHYSIFIRKNSTIFYGQKSFKQHEIFLQGRIPKTIKWKEDDVFLFNKRCHLLPSILSKEPSSAFSNLLPFHRQSAEL